MEFLTINEDNLKKIRKTIQDSNINFLIGAGMSRPFLSVLGDIEKELDEANTEVKKITAKRKYYTGAMEGNLDILNGVSNQKKDQTLSSYINFYKIWNYIMLKRRSSILTKQVNIFTTNIDIFSEKALEQTRLEFNDGFSGKFQQVFDIGNFKKSFYRKSLHYENTSEIPVFNLLKIHGSLTWKSSKDVIALDSNLKCIMDIKRTTTDSDFLKEYNKLMIVNPAKTKFEDVLLNQYYYDLLRIYSNELEKENSVLFAIGFSFADKHIRDLTLRVADSNPTLQIYLFSHSNIPGSEVVYLKNNSKNKNIEIIAPEESGYKYSFDKLNEDFFSKIIDFDEPLEDESSVIDNEEAENEE